LQLEDLSVVMNRVPSHLNRTRIKLFWSFFPSFSVGVKLA